MNIIVLPPKIKNLKIGEDIIKGNGIVYLSNPIIQRHYINLESYPNLVFEDAPDHMGKDYSGSIDSHALAFASHWCQQKGVVDRITFKGVNLGTLFIAVLKYYFVGVIKSLINSDALLNRYNSFNFYLIDDRSSYSRAFLYLARKLNIDVKVIHPRMQKRQKLISPEFVKSLCKHYLANRNKPQFRDNIKGGIVYSSSLKYVEPLWSSIGKDTSNFYLRPVFSYKAHRLTSRLNSDIKITHILPKYFLSAKDRFSIRKEVDIEAVAKYIDSHFSGTDFFTYGGYHIWDIVREDILRMLESRMHRYCQWITSFYNLFNRVRPAVIIVDEDHCDFNHALIMCANISGIKSYQILHGLIGTGWIIPPVHTTKILVAGESSKKRLVDKGAIADKVVVAGAPHYEHLIESVDRDRDRADFSCRFNLKPHEKIITLATQPLRSEENPDCLNTYVTPGNIEGMIRISLMAIKSSKSAKLIIKLHPADNYIWFTKRIVDEENCGDCVIILRDYDVMKLLASTDLLLVSGSTVYLEGLLLRVPILIFDDSKRRFLEFMSKTFLDLSDETTSIETIRDFIEDERLRRKRLEEQEEELTSHFYNKNAGALNNFERLILSTMGG